jgi:modulator of FtsH protease
MSLFDNKNKNQGSNTPQSNQNVQSIAFGGGANEQVLKPAESTEEVNKLIRQTYTLLSITLFFSAIMAGVAMMMEMPRVHWLLYLVGFIGLFFLTYALRNSVWGLAAIFALTGFMGLTLGPIINMYLTVFSNGAQIVMLAFGLTGAIFLGLSGYALTTRKDFSFMSAFLFAGIIVVVVASLANIFFQIPALSLALSAVMVLLMAGYILYDTSNMVHGYEKNYIMATVTLYVDIYLLFLNLLQLLGFLGGEN